MRIYISKENQKLAGTSWFLKLKTRIQLVSENTWFLQTPISIQINFPKSTVYVVIKQYKESASINRANKFDRKAVLADKNLYQMIIMSVKQNLGHSDVKRAK
jgi:hypothetical protein